MCVNARISHYLSLVSHGTHGIEVQNGGRRIAVFNRHKSLKRNWREAVQSALERKALLFLQAKEAQSFVEQHGGVVYTWQCFGTQNWLRRGVMNVDALCYTVLPTDAPESVRLPDDNGHNEPQDECVVSEKING
jgi:hypothetical protein